MARRARYIVCCDQSFVSGGNPLGLYPYIAASGWDVALRSLVNGVGPSCYTTATYCDTVFSWVLGSYGVGAEPLVGVDPVGNNIYTTPRGIDQLQVMCDTFPDFVAAHQAFCAYAHSYGNRVLYYTAPPPLVLSALPGGAPVASDATRVDGYVRAMLGLGGDFYPMDSAGACVQVDPVNAPTNSLRALQAFQRLGGIGVGGGEPFDQRISTITPNINGQMHAYATYSAYSFRKLSASWYSPSRSVDATEWFVELSAAEPKDLRQAVWASGLPNVTPVVEINDF